MPSTGLSTLNRLFLVTSAQSYQIDRLILTLQLGKWKDKEVITFQAHGAILPIIRKDLGDRGGLTLCSEAPGTTVEARAPQEGKLERETPTLSPILLSPYVRQNNSPSKVSLS